MSLKVPDCITLVPLPALGSGKQQESEFMTDVIAHKLVSPSAFPRLTGHHCIEPAPGLAAA
jgi:hypothetical protein